MPSKVAMSEKKCCSCRESGLVRRGQRKKWRRTPKKKRTPLMGVLLLKPHSRLLPPSRNHSLLLLGVLPSQTTSLISK